MDDDLADVVRREQQLLDPEVRASPACAGALLHPDYVEYGASGRVWDRATILEALAEDPEASGEATDFEAARLADGVVLLTYRITGSTGSLRSSVWVREPDHGWRVRFHQGTRAAEA